LNSEIIDLPGIYSLTTEDEYNQDELITVKELLNQKFDIILNIVDATNLERHLYLTLQLLELNMPMILALNMADLVERKFERVNNKILENELGVKVSEICARTGKGINHLIKLLKKARKPKHEIINKYPQQIFQIISDLRIKLKTNLHIAIKAIEENYITSNSTFVKVNSARNEIRKLFDDDPDIIFMSIRYELINKLLPKIIVKSENSQAINIKLDKIVLNRYLSPFIFLTIMYLMFTFSIIVGGALQPYFTKVADFIFIDLVRSAAQFFKFNDFITYILSNGLGGGISLVITFVPIIAALYLFLSLLEDSGYMSRAAFIADFYMRKIGLPGKAFVPLILGFGCNVPAIMTTRTLERKEDRIVSALMAPFMACGARLTFFVIFANFFFEQFAYTIIFIMYIIGVCIALLTGIILRKFFREHKASYFVMVLPNDNITKLNALIINTY